MNSPITRTMRLIAHESGATAVEYALMVALIAIAIVGAVAALGLFLPDLFNAADAGLGLG